MDQYFKDPTSGPPKSPSVDVYGQVGNAWRIPRRTDAYHTSTDASFVKKLHQEDDSEDPLGDIEASAIGSLLPDDEDELLAGIMDDLDLSGLPTQLEDFEDDFFGSGGGMELDFESLNIGLSNLSMSDGVSVNGIGHYSLTNGVATVAGEHPYGEHPSRTLFVRNINSNVEDSELRALFEQYGDIRTLYTACKHRGFVMISYYDIRSARTAMRALQNKPLRRRKLDIHFSIPKDNPSEKDVNQGTLVVFNLDASVSNDDLRQIFGAYGEVKEIRETPHKRHHKFIEFYDVRAAEAALKALNRSDIAGKRIKLEPSRPGGARRKAVMTGNWPHLNSPVEHNPLQGFSQSPGLGNFSPLKSSNMPGLASILPPQFANHAKIPPIGKDQGTISHGSQGNGPMSHTFPEQKLTASSAPMSSFGESNANSSGIGTLSGPQFLWGSPTPYSDHTSPSAWSTSSVGHPFASSSQGQGYPFSNPHGPFIGSPNPHHVGSAPSGVLLDRHFGYFPESPDTSFMSSGGFGGTSLGRKTASYVMNVGPHPVMSAGLSFPGNMPENGSPSSRMMSLSRNGPMYIANGSFQGIGLTSNEGLLERSRSRKVEYNVNQIDSKKQYQLDLDKIKSGEDTKTTLMIKNIPNKYTSKMLLAAIDENHRGSYDFLYLPIDFKNKCNVGYAFINMVSPSHIIPFYEALNGKKWEKFNSEKVASLAYARIQGKVALVTHFQNSSLMNEDKRCRPILFQSEGQEFVDQEPLLSSNLNICIRQPDGSYSGDSLDSPKSNPDEKQEI
ncbi:hypothetical protein RHGRI_017278 [Rhododendron griersonianum]|uniref:RRM domain-containing protein n=1 Tax=Rhododendron griersonianum TaxID=479676 RepID=A0AAV6JX76_9ERIC|nr:hypothetical protein RHGRI_017278 [Rhododendron griersonianum]